MRRPGVRLIALAVPLAAAAVGGYAFLSYRTAMGEAEAAWARIAVRPETTAGVFDPASPSDLPEIARRYFNHAIAPGTPLRKTVELEMRGTFLLGTKRSYRAYRMTARQILAPPDQFVWLPELRSGLIRISGSDALVSGSAWMRFWLMRLVPVADERTSADLVRSAVFRSAMEGIWVPASLLPENGVRWKQVGPDRARVIIQSVDPPIALELTLAPDGAVREVIGQRWSNANPDKVFQLQPFGGTIHSEASFGGFTIPSVVRVGNHFGTEEYVPFFQAEVIRASRI